MSDDSTKSKSAPPKGLLARCLQFVVTLAVFAGIGVLGIATYANWRREGKVSFRVFDTVWWGVGRSEAEPYVEGARTAADKAYVAVWGPDGMVEQGERWLDSLRRPDPAPGDPATPVPPTSASDPAKPRLSPPTTAARSAEATKLEARFTTAEKAFRDGLAAYKRAAKGSESARRGARQDAIGHFSRCRDVLLATIDPYRAVSDHDRARLTEAEELGRVNQRFLHSAQKDAGGL